LLRDELAPRGDDPGGILPDLGHVGEPNAVGISPEPPPQLFDLLGADDHQDRFTGRDRIIDEGSGTVDELRGACVEECVVTESGSVRSFWGIRTHASSTKSRDDRVLSEDLTQPASKSTYLATSSRCSGDVSLLL
jgi:hypothetical protein